MLYTCRYQCVSLTIPSPGKERHTLTLKDTFQLKYFPILKLYNIFDQKLSLELFEVIKIIKSPILIYRFVINVLTHVAVG